MKSGAAPIPITPKVYFFNLFSNIKAIHPPSEDPTIIIGCFSFFFGALGLLFTYFLVKTSKDASKSSWRRFTLFTAIIAALTFVFSLTALLSQNATLINVALISIMLPVPVINLIWVASFVRQTRKVIRD